MARDQVRVDARVEHPQPGIQIVGPDRCVPFNPPLTSPDVVHQDVQPALLGVDPPHQRFHLRRLEVVDGGGDPLASGRAYQGRRLLDGLGPAVL